MMLKTRYGPLWMMPPSRNLLYVYWGKNQSHLNHLTQFPFIRLSQNKHISELLPPWNVINHPLPLPTVCPRYTMLAGKGLFTLIARFRNKGLLCCINGRYTLGSLLWLLNL